VIDSFSDRPAHWSSGPSFGTGVSKRAASGGGSSSSTNRRRTEGISTSRQTASSSLSKKSRSSLPLTSSSIHSQDHRRGSGAGGALGPGAGAGARMLAGGALKVSFQPSFLATAKSRVGLPVASASNGEKEAGRSGGGGGYSASHGIDGDQIVEAGEGEAGEDDGCGEEEEEEKDRTPHRQNQSLPSTSGLSLITGHTHRNGSSTVGNGYGYGNGGSVSHTAPDSASPVKHRPPSSRYSSASSSASRKYRKGSLSQQLQTVWKEEDGLGVRFSASCDQNRSLVMREVTGPVGSGLGCVWEEVATSVGRGRDLQDPRSRAQRWVDVRVLTASAAAWEGSTSGQQGERDSSLLLLRLQVHGAGSNMRGRSEGDGEPLGQPSPEPGMGEILAGMFKRGVGRTMRVSLDVGSTMRIYNYVYIPPMGNRQKASAGIGGEERVDINEGGLDVGDFESIGHLLCTQLCERIELLVSSVE
jgi:hypothetical protein